MADKMNCTDDPLPFELHPLGLTASYPGFLEDDFNRAGFFRPERMAKLLESWRGAMLRFHPVLLQLFVPNRTVVVLSNNYYILPKFFDYTAGKRSFPFTIFGKVCNAGRSSFQMEQALYAETDKINKLVMCTTTVIYLNIETRRPADLPQGMKAVVGKQENSERHLAIPDKLPKSHCYEVTVEPSDIDYNSHANQSVYVRMCSDCAMDAQRQSFYTGLDLIQGHPVIEFETFYRDESREGDALKVFTWQDQDNNNVIHFFISLRSRPIFYSRWLVGAKVKPVMARY